MSEESVAERLMNALISKMETMDGDLQMLKAENQQLRNAVSDPISMLRKAGFVPASTPLSQDVSKFLILVEEILLRIPLMKIHDFFLELKKFLLIESRRLPKILAPKELIAL